LSSNSQYAKAGDAFGKEAVDKKLFQAADEVIDELAGRRSSARAESEMG